MTHMIAMERPICPGVHQSGKRASSALILFSLGHTQKAKIEDAHSNKKKAAGDFNNFFFPMKIDGTAGGDPKSQRNWSE